MEVMLWLSGVTSLAVAFCLGLLVVVVGYRAFERLNPSVDERQELEDGNLAVAVLAGSFMISLGYMLRTAVGPIVLTFFNALHRIRYGEATLLDAVWASLVMLFQLGASLAIAIAVLVLGTRTFMWLNRGLNELEEIRRGNLAVALLVGAITFTLALLVEQGMDRFLQALIPSTPIQNDTLLPFG